MPQRTRQLLLALSCLIGLTLALGHAPPAGAQSGLSRVNHIIIVMQENHSFDNYLGVLPLAPSSPYHPGPCDPDDHQCVDGLSCQRDPHTGAYTCHNANTDDGGLVVAFHATDFCVRTDLAHGWVGTHAECNVRAPNACLASSPNDGFVLVNDITHQPDRGGENPTEDATMSFYNEDDLAFYYALAETFAINDRYFSSVLGPTFPNRAYLMAATAFGHLTNGEARVHRARPLSAFYQPITGTIFDLLDHHQVFWVDYFSDVPQGASFRNPVTDPHFQPIQAFFAAAQAGTLPAVAWVDAAVGVPNPAAENDEHPGSDLRAGQHFVAQVVSAVRTGPNWPDSIVFITYDEHGGFYDHVAPSAAPQGGALTPDGIAPGQCADASNPPASEQPGGGQHCRASAAMEAVFCPGFTATGPFPAHCANFNQLGFRVPFIAVSPFAKPHYVSHTVGDHTSLLALLEKRFLDEQHLTGRDAHADTLEELFDFSGAPSRNAPVWPALAPAPSTPCAP
jgi:phospholipase C